MAKRALVGQQNHMKRLLVLVGVIVVLALLQIPVWGSVSSRVQRFQEIRSQTEQVEEVKARTLSVQENHDSQKDFLDQLTIVIPDKQDTLQVIERLERLASQHGLVLEVSAIEEGRALVEVGGTAAEIPEQESEDEEDTVAPVQNTIRIFPLIISASATATPAQLLAYLDAVEHVQELVQVQKVSMIPAPEFEAATPGPRPFRLELEIEFYLQQ